MEVPQNKTQNLDQTEPHWVIPDSKGFQTFLQTKFPSMLEDVPVETTLELLQNQKIVSNFLRERTPYRGLLLYHGLGSGKSAASITIAEGYENRDIVVLLPASLHSNFSQEMRNFETTNAYTILHYNSPLVVQNVVKQLLPKNTYSTILHKIKRRSESSPIRIYPRRITREERLSENEMTKFLDDMYDPSREVSNPFSGKTIIIDEVHNLTSMILGGGVRGALLYELIIRAKNVRLICLSGTPAINSVYELAILFNLLRGHMTLHTFSIEPTKKKNVEIKELLRKNPYINRIYITSKTISVTEYPQGFKGDIEHGSLVMDATHNNTDTEFHSNVQSLLESLNISVTESSITHEPLFQDILQKGPQYQHKMYTSPKYTEKVKEAFLSTFVNDRVMKNPDLFKKRIAGLVSFYSGVDKSMFPALIQHDIIYTDMSDFQYKQYAEDRRIEAVLEKRNKMNQSAQVTEAVTNTKSSASYFRVLSRQSSLFAFPPFDEEGNHLVRPRAKLLREEYTARYQEEHPDDNTGPDRKEVNMYVKQEMGKRLHKLMKSLSHWNTVPFQLEVALRDFSNKHNIDAKKLLDVVAEANDKEIENITPRDLFSMKSIPESDWLSKEQIKTLNLFIKVLQFPLEVCSPKFAQLLSNMNASPGLIFAYSQFRSAEGIEMYKRTLLNIGYKEYKTDMNSVPVVGDVCRFPTSPNEETCSDWKTGIVKSIKKGSFTIETFDKEEFISKIAHVATFSLWTGTETSDKNKLEKVQATFNGLNNKYGQVIQILLATESGAEGISLKNVRQVHVFEPFWNDVRIEQVVGRARRVNSHAALPKEQRNVEVFNYVARISEEQKSGTWVSDYSQSLCNLTDLRLDNETLEETNEVDHDTLRQRARSLLFSYSDEITKRDDGYSSDEMLMKIATKKNVLIQQFLTAMKEAAVDCVLHKAANKSNDIDVDCMKNIIQDGDYTFEPIITQQSEDKFQNVRQTKVMDYSIIVKTNNFRVIVPLQNADELLDEITTSRPVYDYYIYNDFMRHSNKPSFMKHKVGKFEKGVFVIDSDVEKEKWIVIENVIRSKVTLEPSIIRNAFEEAWDTYQTTLSSNNVQDILKERMRLLRQ